jgi:hypothetical protein
MTSRKTIDDTRTLDGRPLITKEVVEQKIEDREISEMLARQEYYCEILAPNENQIFDMDKVVECGKRKPKTEAITTPLIMGVDVAREGDDDTVIVFRRGSDMSSIPPIRFHGLDGQQLAQRIIGLQEDTKAHYINIDVSNVGASCCDFLSFYGVPHNPIKFGERANEADRYPNRRSEMYHEFAEWTEDIDSSLCLTDMLIEEVQATVRKKYDNKSRPLLLEKSEIKKMIQRSPDEGDACALTFAENYPPVNITGTGSVPRKMKSTWQ